MVNNFIKNSGIDAVTGGAATGAGFISDEIQGGNSKLQNKFEDLASKAEEWGIPPAFLGKENKNRGLSSAVERLLTTIDRTAQRSYIGHGFADYRKDYPNTKSVITQTPEAIVLIKKRMFSSLSENFKTERLDQDEVYFIKAAKKLFENKCQQISAYEKITKLNKVLIDTGVLTTPIANAIYEAITAIEGTDFNAAGGVPGFSVGGAASFYSGVLNKQSLEYIQKNADGIKRIRDALTLNGFNQTTTWISNTKYQKQMPFGNGTGVIELTLINSLNTKTSVNMSESGSCTFTVSDPCKLFFIDEFDIEKALGQASRTPFSIINIVTDTLESDTEAMKQQLNEIRAARGASVLEYLLDITTKVYNKVTIILEGIGYQLTKSDGSGLNYEGLIDNPTINPVEAFSSSEQKLLNKIYKNIFKIQQVRMKDYVNYKLDNEKINYTRKLMRMNFLGREIIQPMDAVTIFIDSQTLDDKLIANGMKETFSDMTNAIKMPDWAGGGQFPNFMGATANTFGSTNFLALLNRTVGKMKALKETTSQTGISADEATKNLLAGKDFPYWLWDKLRGNFTSGALGTCVFCGLVERANESFNDGSYMLNVSVKDNTAYLEQGWIQTQPGLDQFNGYLYDPLTPFDFEFDASSGQLPDVGNFKLLPQNRELLASKNSKVTMPDGKHAGEAATLKTFGDPDVDVVRGVSQVQETFENIRSRIYSAPDGFVYRWKRGIGTAIVNQTGCKDGIMSDKLVQEDMALVAEQDPFGGQDLANVASILICGEPYNFNTFFQASKIWGTLSNESDFNPDSDYFQGLFRRIKRQNKLWGSFIPFKQFTVDPKTWSVSVATQMLTYAHTTAIKKAQDKKARLLSQLMQYEGDTGVVDLSQFQLNFTGTQVPTIATYHPSITMPIIKQILEQDALIQIHTEIISQALQQNQANKGGGIIAIGDNAYYSSNDKQTSSSSITNARRILSAQQNEITKRRLWQSKANVDRNLFIVGSEYDEDYDIQTISQSLSNNFQFINTNWQKIKEKLSTIAVEVLGMELFANSQGHIELRTPKYNRIPSSILYDMMKRKSELGIQIYPTFLEKTFKNQVESVFSEIEAIEDQIRLRCMALGVRNIQSEMQQFLSGSTKANGGPFEFVTDFVNGTLTSIRTAVKQINKDYEKAFQGDSSWWNPIEMTGTMDEFFKRPGNNSQEIIVFSKQAKFNQSQFDITKQVDNYNKIVSNVEDTIGVLLSTNDTDAAKIRKRISDRLGKPINAVPTLDQLLPNSNMLNGKLSPIDINKLQNEIQSFIVQRYESLQIAVNLIKNLDSASRINAPNSDIYNKLLMPNLYGTNNIPDFLLDMVEDETYDDYGLDSGKRFVLREKDIITMDYREENPEFTQVEITGSEMGGLVGGQGFDIGGGIQLSKVWAVDFDLWRQYGFKSMTQKHLPFLNNAETQLAPFAMFLLNKERARLINATVTIRGNEFVQPGEVYYIQERGMLFYSKSISHSFTYGGSFKTTLELNYGHVPGEYIPTPLDVIGKSLYKGEHFNIGNYRIARGGTTANSVGTNIGAFAFPNYAKIGRDSSADANYQLFTDGTYGNINKNTLQDIKGKILFLADKTLPNTNAKYQAITVRVYTQDSATINAAKEIIKQLTATLSKSKIIGGNDWEGTNGLKIGEVMIVDMGKDNPKTMRNPSDLAWDLARNMAQGPYGQSNNKSLTLDKDFLQLHVIDVWIENSVVSNEVIVQAKKEVGQTQKSGALSTMLTAYNKLQQNNVASLPTLVTIVPKLNQ